MKKLILAAFALTLAGAANARAEGFVCQTTDESLEVKVFHHVDANDGTRNAAVLVLSDPAVGAGRKTIARFSSVNGTLSNEAALYVARVDLRFNDSGRAGENILGTKLGELRQVVAAIDFSYDQPVVAGTVVDGQLTLIKRNEGKIEEPMSCVRYLKGE